MIKRIYTYMTEPNGEPIIENGFRYLVGSSEFTLEDAKSAAKAHSRLSHSTGCYIFKTATEDMGGFYAVADTD